MLYFGPHITFQQRVYHISANCAWFSVPVAMLKFDHDSGSMQATEVTTSVVDMVAWGIGIGPTRPCAQMCFETPVISQEFDDHYTHWVRLIKMNSLP